MDQSSSDHSENELKDESSLSSGCYSSFDEEDDYYDQELEDIRYINESTDDTILNSFINMDNTLDFKIPVFVQDYNNKSNNIKVETQDGYNSDDNYPGYLIEYSINIDNDKYQDLPEDNEKTTQKEIESNCKYDFELQMVYNILLFMNIGFENQFILRSNLNNGTCTTNDEYYYNNRYYDIKSINNKNNNNYNNNTNNYNTNNENNNNINQNQYKNIEGLENYNSYTFKFNPVSLSFEFNNNNFGNKNRFQS